MAAAPAAPAAPVAQPAAPAQQGGQPAAPVVTPKPLPPDKALNMQALADMAAGAPQKARDALAKAAEISQDNPVIIFNLGVADYKLGQFAPAARSFSKSRQIYEGSKSDLDRKIKLYEEMDALPGGSDRPFRLMKAMIRANTLLADTVTYQGKAREGLGEVMDARRFYREAAGLYRESAVLYNRLGDLHRRGGDVKGAVQSYAHAAKADPRYAEPWKQLSLIAVDQKKQDLANKYLAIYRRLSGQ
ncbi:MAG: hypothetical protein FJZ00_10255 [Candidatus Sericytochromatia bacterium]|uniref:Tetratricopeptide repeat protein n=1 Tax=Candidatus Tanganyikabacteria bacterium TaxID=2961651 RepID=A0A937X686_9BACT|nr:hypothetical protein [Candidatus Tanganyikabacteria bacterium]